MKKVMVVAITFYNGFAAKKAMVVVVIFFGGVVAKKAMTCCHRFFSFFLAFFSGFATKKTIVSSCCIHFIFSRLLSFKIFSSMVLLLQRRLVH